MLTFQSPTELIQTSESDQSHTNCLTNSLGMLLSKFSLLFITKIEKYLAIWSHCSDPT